MKTVTDIDELEALMAELNDEDLAALEVPAGPEPEPEPQPAVADPVAELDSDDLALLDDLGLDVDEALEPVKAAAEPEPEPEPTPTPTQVEDEIDALVEAAAAEHEEAQTDSAATTESETVETFKPTSGLKTFIDPDRLQADLDFNTANISNAMTRQAALFAHYSALAAQAQFQADRADQQVDLVEAQLDQHYRDALAASGVKITENMVKASITKDSRYQAALTRKYEAKAIAEMVKSAADSFRHRRDMLIQVGADLREEMKGRVQTRVHPGEAALAAMSA